MDAPNAPAAAGCPRPRPGSSADPWRHVKPVLAKWIPEVGGRGSGSAVRDEDLRSFPVLTPEAYDEGGIDGLRRRFRRFARAAHPDKHPRKSEKERYELLMKHGQSEFLDIVQWVQAKPYTGQELVETLYDVYARGVPPPDIDASASAGARAPPGSTVDELMEWLADVCSNQFSEITRDFGEALLREYLTDELAMHPDTEGTFWTQGRSFLSLRFATWRWAKLCETDPDEQAQIGSEIPWNRNATAGHCPSCDGLLYTAFRLGGGSCGDGHIVCLECLAKHPRLREARCFVCHGSEAPPDPAGAGGDGRVPYAWDQASVDRAWGANKAGCERSFGKLLKWVFDGSFENFSDDRRIAEEHERVERRTSQRLSRLPPAGRAPTDAGSELDGREENGGSDDDESEEYRESESDGEGEEEDSEGGEAANPDDHDDHEEEEAHSADDENTGVEANAEMAGRDDQAPQRAQGAGANSAPRPSTAAPAAGGAQSRPRASAGGPAADRESDEDPDVMYVDERNPDKGGNYEKRGPKDMIATFNKKAGGIEEASALAGHLVLWAAAAPRTRPAASGAEPPANLYDDSVTFDSFDASSEERARWTVLGALDTSSTTTSALIAGSVLVARGIQLGSSDTIARDILLGDGRASGLTKNEIYKLLALATGKTANTIRQEVEAKEAEVARYREQNPGTKGNRGKKLNQKPAELLRVLTNVAKVAEILPAVSTLPTPPGVEANSVKQLGKILGTKLGKEGSRSDELIVALKNLVVARLLEREANNVEKEHLLRRDFLLLYKKYHDAMGRLQVVDRLIHLAEDAGRRKFPRLQKETLETRGEDVQRRRGGSGSNPAVGKQTDVEKDIQDLIRYKRELKLEAEIRSVKAAVESFVGKIDLEDMQACRSVVEHAHQEAAKIFRPRVRNTPAPGDSGGRVATPTRAAAPSTPAAAPAAPAGAPSSPAPTAPPPSGQGGRGASPSRSPAHTPPPSTSSTKADAMAKNASGSSGGARSGAQTVPPAPVTSPAPAAPPQPAPADMSELFGSPGPTLRPAPGSRSSKPPPAPKAAPSKGAKVGAAAGASSSPAPPPAASSSTPEMPPPPSGPATLPKIPRKQGATPPVAVAAASPAPPPAVLPHTHATTSSGEAPAPAAAAPRQAELPTTSAPATAQHGAASDGEAAPGAEKKKKTKKKGPEEAEPAPAPAAARPAELPPPSAPPPTTPAHTETERAPAAAKRAAASDGEAAAARRKKKKEAAGAEAVPAAARPAEPASEPPPAAPGPGATDG